MERVTQAVVLAAGRGTRIAGTIGEIPKGFIEIGGRPIIERSVEILLEHGIRRIVIVSGHLAHFYAELAGRHAEVETIENPRFAESGSMYSLYVAREAVTAPFLLVESDILYERRAVSALLGLEQEDAVLVSGPTGSGDEVYVGAEAGRITGIGKIRGEVPSVVGELVGVSRISPQLFDAMNDFAAEGFKRTLHLEYDSDVLADVAAAEPVGYHLVDDLAWCEIDDAAHLERARNVVFPKILEADRRHGDGDRDA